jgi:hypothetical protein
MSSAAIPAPPPLATQTVDGLMSSTDKTKLDGISGGGGIDLSQPVVSTFADTGGASPLVKKANFDASSNPAQTSPALANFNKPLEIGGNCYTSPADTDSSVYIGSFAERTAGAILTLLNNYGSDNFAEIPTHRFMHNGDAEFHGDLTLNGRAGSDGRINTTGLLYLLSTAMQIVWNQGNDDIVQWYTGGGTLKASLDATGQLTATKFNLGAGDAASYLYRAFADVIGVAGSLFVNASLSLRNDSPGAKLSIGTSGTEQLGIDCATGTVTHAGALTLNPGTTFAVHGSNLDVDTSGNVIAVGKVKATGGIGVGNAVAASSPGSVVKKMEVFDANGNSLGFVPIYSSIT